MYIMSNKTKKNIERVVGLPFSQIQQLDLSEEKKWLQKKCQFNGFTKRVRYAIIGRGNPLLARKKIRTIEDLNKKSKKYLGI